jgi:hypothetical protein
MSERGHACGGFLSRFPVCSTCVVVKPMPETVVHFQVRMPPPLHERLSSQAKEDKSSLNALVVSLLTRALEQPDKRKPTPTGQAGS